MNLLLFILKILLDKLKQCCYEITKQNVWITTKNESKQMIEAKFVKQNK
jgi:hypothetical protein